MSNLLKKLADKANAAVQARVDPQPVQVPAPAVQAPAAPVAPVVAVPVAPVAAPVAPVASAPQTSGCRPAPWPIDIRDMTAEQISRMTREEEDRANYWSGARMTAGLMGNGDPKVNAGAQFNIYRARYSTSADLNADWTTGLWGEIWTEFVKQPLPKIGAVDPGWAKIDEAYKARAANGGVDPAPAQPVAPTPAPQVGGDEDVSVES